MMMCHWMVILLEEIDEKETGFPWISTELYRAWPFYNIVLYCADKSEISSSICIISCMNGMRERERRAR